MKEEKEKKVKLYDTNDEWKIQKSLSLMLMTGKNDYSKKVFNNSKPLMIMDGANVMCVVALSYRAKKILIRFVDDELMVMDLKKFFKTPDLCYKKNSDSGASFSIDYLERIFSFVKTLKSLNEGFESVVFKVAKDYPLTIESEDWRIILAPRVSDD